MSHPRCRVVLLGASNLTRSVSTVVETARLAVGGSASILVAAGHGRSFGQRSRVLGRTLPGIIECGLWETLAVPADAVATFALVTDVGNDVMYGVDASTIAAWVSECLDRLQRLGARIVMTGLPMDSIGGLTPLTFGVARTLLFPGRRLTLDEARVRAGELNDALESMAADRAIHLEPLPGECYGLDPIHLRRRVWPAVFERLTRPWLEPVEPPPARARPSLRRWLRLRSAPAHDWSLFGHSLGRPQPSRHLPGGTTVSFY